MEQYRARRAEQNTLSGRRLMTSGMSWLDTAPNQPSRPGGARRGLDSRPATRTIGDDYRARRAEQSGADTMWAPRRAPGSPLRRQLSGSPKARRRLRATALPWLVLACVLAFGTGTATALWGTSATYTLAAQTAVAGFSVQRDDEEADVAKGPSDPVSFELTSADAIAAQNGTVAIDFTVQMMTSGTNGMDYTIEIGQPEADSFFASAEIDIFPQGTGGCAGATPGGALWDGTPIKHEGVAPSQSVNPVTVTSDAWCIVITGASTRTYLTRAQAQGLNPLGAPMISDTSIWQVTVGPDPAAQQPVHVTLKHKITRNAEANR